MRTRHVQSIVVERPIASTPALTFQHMYVEPYYVGLLCPQRYVDISPRIVLVFHESVQVLHAEIPSFGQGRRRDKILNQVKDLFKRQTDKPKRSLVLHVEVNGISQCTQATEIKKPEWNEDLPL